MVLDRLETESMSSSVFSVPEVPRARGTFWEQFLEARKSTGQEKSKTISWVKIQREMAEKHPSFDMTKEQIRAKVKYMKKTYLKRKMTKKKE